MFLGEAQAKLVAALRDAHAPDVMIGRALEGVYDDYKTTESTPILRLVMDAQAYGLTEIAKQAKAGDFDGTIADGKAWTRSIRGQRATQECERAA